MMPLEVKCKDAGAREGCAGISALRRMPTSNSCDEVQPSWLLTRSVNSPRGAAPGGVVTMIIRR